MCMGVNMQWLCVYVSMCLNCSPVAVCIHQARVLKGSTVILLISCPRTSESSIRSRAERSFPTGSKGLPLPSTGWLRAAVRMKKVGEESDKRIGKFVEVAFLSPLMTFANFPHNSFINGHMLYVHRPYCPA